MCLNDRLIGMLGLCASKSATIGLHALTHTHKCTHTHTSPGMGEVVQHAGCEGKLHMGA
jgi:hypothetical protein